MPVFAPPNIRKGDFVLNQTPAIVKYLGKEFGFYPSNKADEAHAEALIGFVTDVIAEGRLVFHAHRFTDSYYTQREGRRPQATSSGMRLRDCLSLWDILRQCLLTTQKNIVRDLLSAKR